MKLRAFYYNRYLALILTHVLLVSPILSCERPGSPSAGKRPQDENVLRYDVSAPFGSLKPEEVYVSGSIIIFPLLYSFLFVPNAKGKLKPDLATKWIYDPERFTWTIHLRKDALFHNMQRVTSEDVRNSLEAQLKKIRPAVFSIIDKISLLSETAIRITLKKDDSGFLKKIWDMEIVPQNTEGEIDFYDHPIGSGPFKFKYREREKQVCFEANKDYFDGRPPLDEIIFYFQPNKEKIWTRLLSGRTDIASELSPKNYEIMKQYEKRFYFDLYTMRWYTILLYNTNDPLFSDTKVRRALTHAIDREYIVKNILRGYGKVAVGPMGVNSPYHDSSVKPIPYDPEKGLKLLEEAGWYYDSKSSYLNKKGRAFEFTILLFKESQVEKTVARYVKLCLNDLGIKVRVQSLPFKELTRRHLGNNEFQAVLTEFSGASDAPERELRLWYPEGGKRSDAGSFEHPEVTSLIRHALDEEDPLEKKRFFQKVDAVIVSLQPGTFLFHKTAIDVMSKRFKLTDPFSLTHEGIYRLRYASLAAR